MSRKPDIWNSAPIRDHGSLSTSAVSDEVSAVPRTILLAEDDEVVQAIVQRLLVRAGYAVLTADDGGEALEMLERHGNEIDLFLTDVVLPKVQGHEVAAFAVENFSSMSVLFVSGYPEDSRRTGQSRFPGAWFLAKPFTPEELLVTVRSLIDSPGREASSGAHS